MTVGVTFRWPHQAEQNRPVPRLWPLAGAGRQGRSPSHALVVRERPRGGGNRWSGLNTIPVDQGHMRDRACKRGVRLSQAMSKRNMRDRASNDWRPGSSPGRLVHMHDRANRSVTWGEEIRRRRLELGLHQDELAALAGVSTRFVHTLEQGKPSLQLDKILAVLSQLGLDLVLEPGTGIIRYGED